MSPPWTTAGRDRPTTRPLWAARRAARAARRRALDGGRLKHEVPGSQLRYNGTKSNPKRFAPTGSLGAATAGGAGAGRLGALPLRPAARGAAAAAAGAPPRWPGLSLEPPLTPCAASRAAAGAAAARPARALGLAASGKAAVWPQWWQRTRSSRRRAAGRRGHLRCAAVLFSPGTSTVQQWQQTRCRSRCGSAMASWSAYTSSCRTKTRESSGASCACRCAKRQRYPTRRSCAIDADRAAPPPLAGQPPSEVASPPPGQAVCARRPERPRGASGAPDLLSPLPRCAETARTPRASISALCSSSPISSR